MRFQRLPYIVDPSRRPCFPPELEPDGHGLVAVGGTLDPPILLEAYAKGIFPWHDDPAVFWFSPDPRMVLYPGSHHVPRRLSRTIRQRRFRIAFDTDTERVILGCAAVPRPGQERTWISARFRSAYTALARQGWVHSVAVYSGGELAGGLYGVCLGRAFCGESMFSLAPDASKVAMYYLVAWSRHKGLAFIDCQVPTPHLAGLGAQEVPRQRFLGELEEAIAGAQPCSWTLEAAELFADVTEVPPDARTLA
jgi:leucyl/phenylalanyl-tRNA--protein transferase